MEGDEVYAKSEGDGQEKLYVEDVKDGVYTLRRDKEKGMRVISDKKFQEGDLSLTKWPTESK